ncbi:hypothetical protein PSEUDO8BK_10054 [Pseudomonas sp. 8BK]|nr:hypothetical protein PSEUDO8BK_10054 [Pseudomonas sp. 8BK]VXC62937.1 hypothetical protein PSEUDO9AZ_11407 [Pseudomonas sp. 9AZ]
MPYHRLGESLFLRYISAPEALSPTGYNPIVGPF